MKKIHVLIGDNVWTNPQATKALIARAEDKESLLIWLNALIEDGGGIVMGKDQYTFDKDSDPWEMKIVDDNDNSERILTNTTANGPTRDSAVLRTQAGWKEFSLEKWWNESAIIPTVAPPVVEEIPQSQKPAKGLENKPETFKCILKLPQEDGKLLGLFMNERGLTSVREMIPEPHKTPEKEKLKTWKQFTISTIPDGRGLRRLIVDDEKRQVRGAFNKSYSPPKEISWFEHFDSEDFVVVSATGPIVPAGTLAAVVIGDMRTFRVYHDGQGSFFMHNYEGATDLAQAYGDVMHWMNDLTEGNFCGYYENEKVKVPKAILPFYNVRSWTHPLLNTGFKFVMGTLVRLDVMTGGKVVLSAADGKGAALSETFMEPVKEGENGPNTIGEFRKGIVVGKKDQDSIYAVGVFSDGDGSHYLAPINEGFTNPEKTTTEDDDADSAERKTEPRHRKQECAESYELPGVFPEEREKVEPIKPTRVISAYALPGECLELRLDGSSLYVTVHEGNGLPSEEVLFKEDLGRAIQPKVLFLGDGTAWCPTKDGDSSNWFFMQAKIYKYTQKPKPPVKPTSSWWNPLTWGN